MYKSQRVLRRSRLILILFCATALLWPATIHSSAEPLILDPVLTRQEELYVQLHGEQLIDAYIEHICSGYTIDPELVKSVVWQESRYNPNATSNHGVDVGLMQVSKRWHSKRALKLGVQDMQDAYGNLVVGIDYLDELIQLNKDVSLALMVYNMGPSKASELWANGQTSGYAKSVMARARKLNSGGV